MNDHKGLLLEIKEKSYLVTSYLFLDMVSLKNNDSGQFNN